MAASEGWPRFRSARPWSSEDWISVTRLAIADPGESGRHDHRSDRDQQQEAPQESERPAPTPLSPSLPETAVGNAAERQVSQMAPQVGGQRRRIGVAIARILAASTCGSRPRARGKRCR